MISTSPNVSLVFSLNPGPSLPFVKTSSEAASNLEIASVAVKNPPLARGLLLQEFLNLSSSAADHCCSLELGLGCT